MSTARFRESVPYRQFDLLFALAAVLVLCVALLAEQLGGGVDSWMRVIGLALVVTVVGSYLTHLLLVRQRTRVTARKLKVDQESFVRQKTRIPLEEIAEVAEEHYPDFAQRYGQTGWLSGERYVSLTGRHGVAIRTRDGGRYFIGSRRAGELAEELRGAIA